MPETPDDELTQEALGSLAPEGAGWPVFNNPHFALLLSHWAEARRGALIPRRADIEPERIARALPLVWLYRLIPGTGDFQCRLAGESVRDAWGQRLIGRRLSDYMAPADSRIVTARWRYLLRLPALMHSARGVAGVGRLSKRAQRLVLPLSDEEGRATIVFGLTLYDFTHEEASLPVMPNTDAVYYRCSAMPKEPPPRLGPDGTIAAEPERPAAD